MNRTENKLFNVKFKAGKVERALLDHQNANVIIIDPPRRGVSDEVLQQIVKIQPEAIIYSSCEISTFTRDTKILASKGYHLEKLTGFDMFPQTDHFELVGLFLK